MARIDHSYRKVQTPDNGIIVLPLSFHSGAAEDGSFPDRQVDGYGSADGYTINGGVTVSSDGIDGAGVLSIERLSIGRYRIVLRREYKFCQAKNASLEIAGGPVEAYPQFESPSLETETGLDGVKRSRLHLQVVNGSGVAVDLTNDDRVNVVLYLKNSSA